MLENLRFDIVEEEIVRIQNEACSAEDLVEIKNNFIKSREETELQNSFWMRAIKNNLMLGSEFTSKEDYTELIESIDAKSVKKFAKKLFKKTDIVEVIMNPAE